MTNADRFYDWLAPRLGHRNPIGCEIGIGHRRWVFTIGHRTIPLTRWLPHPWVGG